LENDPHSGGLFGGIAGLVRGDYEARAEQRKQNLDSLFQSNASLSQESQLLEQEKLNKTAELSLIKSQVDQLENDISELSAKIESSEKISKANQLKKKQLIAKGNILKKELTTTKKELDNQQLSVKQAEDKRDTLQKEYKILVELLSDQ
jgi:chromosome segregation ATPase